MASMKLSVTFLLLLSGLAVFGGTAAAAAKACGVQCFQGGYITCDNYPGKQLEGCACECAPRNGKNCVLHLLSSGTTSNCTVAHQA
ncbi:hypothetical protein PAHAL_9G099500 [Panicum hallii]|uniref:Uncharacterized protein n=1 Tax=Panicum hallii TaxID=206008 RepID=A0A2S3IIG0_9POAL|nr:uncharacterized protein LOC112877551 [Panicum hallii]PAN45179.1 hypothetical protein PAHAL_9G099500 [Panicum hallii]